MAEAISTSLVPTTSVTLTPADLTHSPEGLRETGKAFNLLVAERGLPEALRNFSYNEAKYTVQQIPQRNGDIICLPALQTESGLTPLFQKSSPSGFIPLLTGRIRALTQSFHSRKKGENTEQEQVEIASDLAPDLVDKTLLRRYELISNDAVTGFDLEPFHFRALHLKFILNDPETKSDIRRFHAMHLVMDAVADLDEEYTASCKDLVSRTCTPLYSRSEVIPQKKAILNMYCRSIQLRGEARTRNRFYVNGVAMRIKRQGTLNIVSLLSNNTPWGGDPGIIMAKK